MTGGSRSPGSRFLRNLCHLVSASAGYRDPALRSAEDGRFRFLLLRRMAGMREILAEVSEGAGEPPAAEALGRIEALRRLLDRLAESVHRPPRASRSPPERGRIGEPVLDAILELDLALFDDLDRIEESIDRLARHPRGPGLSESTERLDDCDRFEQRLLERDRLLGQGRSARSISARESPRADTGAAGVRPPV